MIGKLKKLLLPAAVAVAAVCLLASCDQNGNIQTSLGLSPRTLTVQADGGSATISFSAAIEWTTTCNADWVTLSRTSGPAGDFSVTITVAANPSANSRTTSVTVTTLALSEQVVITQEGQKEPDPANDQQSIGGITGGINDWGNGGEADFGKNN